MITIHKRRKVGDIVLIIDDEEDEYYLVRIEERGAEFADICPQYYFDENHDPNCREWRNTSVVDGKGEPTGEHCYHVSECSMRDPV